MKKFNITLGNTVIIGMKIFGMKKNFLKIENKLRLLSIKLLYLQ